MCGSRDWTDAKFIYDALDALLETRRISLVIHGSARGADTAAGLWAGLRSIPVVTFPAKWRPNGVYDPQAGLKRNQMMLDYGRPAMCVAFALPSSRRGTWDMVRRSREAGIDVIVYDGSEIIMEGGRGYGGR